jgi:hypothetical protein
LQEFDVSWSGLVVPPPNEFAELATTDITMYNMSHNNISTLPMDVTTEAMDMSYNLMSVVNTENVHYVKSLIVSHNQIKSWPAGGMGLSDSFPHLEYLDMSHNALATSPLDPAGGISLPPMLSELLVSFDVGALEEIGLPCWHIVGALEHPLSNNFTCDMTLKTISIPAPPDLRLLIVGAATGVLRNARVK